MVKPEEAESKASPQPELSLAALVSETRQLQVLSDDTAYRLARLFNYFGLLVPLFVVLAAMTIQVVADDLPCSHCNMQRLGYFMLALGPALNLRFGFRPSHYGVSLAGAMFLGAVALDMMVRIANQGLDGWGPRALGLHMYSWSLVIALIAGVALIAMLLWERQFALSRSDAYRPTSKIGPALKLALVSVIAIVALDLISVLLECGLGICPDSPPDDYPYLP
ncbi:MAG: disulfide bond formation protein B [Ilumatobacter sp.]|nr:disulfide bond formation protein B [Ilumatobacter sp.]